MVVVTDLAAPDAAEKFLGPIGAGAVEAVSLLVVDPLHFKAAIWVVNLEHALPMNSLSTQRRRAIRQTHLLSCGVSRFSAGEQRMEMRHSQRT